MSYASQAARAVSDADSTLGVLRGQAEQIAMRTEQWRAHRVAAVQQLRATAPAGWVSRANGFEPVTVPAPMTTVDDQERVVVPHNPPTEPASPTAPDRAPAAPERADVPAAPKPPRRGAEAARRALSAPALLGIAGASLLIAASIVFVALAWTSFSPLARGVIVTAVAVLVSGIAIWLKRMHLTISSGAVGIVAMGFAATASLAFSRGGDSVGVFETPTALLIACGAGLVLSRLGIPWVGSAAGLAFAGAAVGYTIAATSTVSAADGPGDPGVVRGVWVWTAVGSLAASALAATYRLWRSAVARAAVQWVSVVWLSVVGTGTALWVWMNDAIAADAVVATVPVIALAVLARWWTALAVGPAAFLTTFVVASGASTLGATPWQQAAAVAASVAILLAVGPRLPVAARLPMLIALSPAYLTVAIASATYSIVITIARIIAGTYVPDTEMWAGVAALVAGLSIAQLRLWRLDSQLVRLVSVVGSAMVVTGSGIVAFGLAESFNRAYHTSVALTMAAAAAGLMLAVRAWADSRAQWLSANSAVAFALVSAFHAGWGVAIGEVHLTVALLVLGGALTVLVWRGFASPWWGAFPAVLVTLSIAPVVVARYGGESEWLVAAGVATGAIIVLAATHLPQRFHPPVLAGTLPAHVVTIATGIALAVDLLGRTVGSGGDSLTPVWLVVAVVGAAGLAGVSRWSVSRGAVDAAALAGSLTAIAVASSSALAAARSWLPDTAAAMALWTIPAAVLLGATSWLWRSRAAVWTSGIAAVGMLTIAGLNGAATLSQPHIAPWLPAAACIAVVGLLAGFSAWWPRVTLAPAVLVMTAGAAAIGSRLGGSSLALVLAVSAAVAAMSLTLWLRRAHARDAAWGAMPALACGVIVGAAATLVSVGQVATLGALDALPDVSWMLVAVSGITSVLLLLLSAVPGPSAVMTSFRRAATVGVLATLLSTSAAVIATLAAAGYDAEQGLPAVSVATAAVAIAGVALLVLGLRLLVARKLLDSRMRGIAEAFGVAWLTLVAIAIMVAVVPAQRPWVVACTSVAAIVVALAAATRWWPALVAAPLAFVTAALPFAILVDRAGYPEAVLSSVVVGATCAWLVQWKRPTLSRLVGIGLAPFTALAAVAVMQLVLVATAALTHDGWVPSGQEFGSVVPWTHLTVLVAAVGLLSLPGVRIRAGSVALVTLALMVSLLVPLVAAAVLGVATLAGAALATRVRCDNGVVIAVSLLGVAWASSSTWAMSATLAVVGVNAILIARRQRDATVAWGLIIAPIAAALAVAVAAVAASVGDPLAAPMAMAAAAGTSFALERAGLDVGGRVLVWVVGVSTVATAMVAGDGRAAGLALTVSSLAWLALAARGRDFAKWWCAVTISLGIGLIFADAGVTVIEAYTLVPAAAAIVLGIMWMRAEPEVRSLVALWPGLALALVPSYCALAINPDSLLRTIALTLAIVVLALLAVKLRWFALVVATATTALTVSALQIIVGSNLVLRLVSFAVVGSLLLAIASWFEKIKTLR